MEKRETSLWGAYNRAEGSLSPLENRGQGEKLSSGKDEGQGHGEDTITAHQVQAGEIQLNMTHGYSHRLKDGPTEKHIAQENSPSVFLQGRAKSVLLKL